MGYVNKKDALMNLSNPKDFDVFKNRFLKTYKDAVEKIVFIKNNQEELYNYISGMNNISLNVGLVLLISCLLIFILYSASAISASLWLLYFWEE